MPKEYIRSRDFDQPHQTVDEESGKTTKYVDYSAARLTWARDEQNVALVIVDMDKDPDGLEAQRFLNLNRQGVNDLIRHLRRARDSAFGADQ